MEGSTRTLPGITLIVLALFLIVNHAVRGAGLSEWGLALLLGIVGFALMISDWLESRFRPSHVEEPRTTSPVVYAAPLPTPEKQVEPLPFDAIPTGKTASAHDVMISVPMQEALVDADVSNPPTRAAAPGKPDDLTVIEGIGPKMSSALVAAGLDTYAKLSNTSEETIRAAVQAAGMRFAPSIPTWAEQASYAARGDFDGLKAFQATLSGGRKG
ncbi:MAG: hypothetical protein K8L97_33370 [Anaerolineae bacterium]|nr:hypothetical protein [Anaerolineae bacterium]